MWIEVEGIICFVDSGKLFNDSVDLLSLARKHECLEVGAQSLIDGLLFEVKAPRIVLENLLVVLVRACKILSDGELVQASVLVLLEEELRDLPWLVLEDPIVNAELDSLAGLLIEDDSCLLS